MKPHWIVLANASQARLLRQDQGGKLTLVESFSHSAGRWKTSELVSDRAGHGSADHSYGGTSYPPRTDPKAKEHRRFARELAEELERHALSGSYESLDLFASSPFLGELKAELGSATARLLAGTHDLDLTAVGPVELPRRIAQARAA